MESRAEKNAVPGTWYAIEMTSITAVVTIRNDYHSLARMAVQSLNSAESRRKYSREILRWLASERPLDRENVQAYMIELRESGAGPSTRNTALAAIRLLAREANIRELLSDAKIAAIERVRSVKQSGNRIGNWLDVQAVKLLIDRAGEGPNGVRNQALIACLAGCGMRRAEVCSLDWSQWQLREGRAVWVDVIGKGAKVRTIACPKWAAEYIDAWKDKNNDKNG